MEPKKSKVSSNTKTRDLRQFDLDTQNIYQSVVILSKRANQIGLEVKEELNSKLSEFTTSTDNLEEVFENREQIEIARHYEQLPKPSLVSISEYLNGKVYYRVPEND